MDQTTKKITRTYPRHKNQQTQTQDKQSQQAQINHRSQVSTTLSFS